MEALKQRIKTEGVAVGSDRINVDGFINHQIDTRFMDEIGAEFGRRFADTPVDKILTVEASGIAIALAAARYFDFVPVVFAKRLRRTRWSRTAIRQTRFRSRSRRTICCVWRKNI